MTRLLLILAVVLSLGLAVTACGDTSGAQVASLPSGTGPTSGAVSGTASASSTPTAGRPTMPIGMTDQQFAQVFNAYAHCLIEHGAKAGAAKPATAGKPALVEIAGPTPAPAAAACLHLLPVPAPELDASTNPHFHEQSLAYVACMKHRGLWVTLLNDHNLDWTYTDGHAVPDDESQIEQDCARQAFGGRR